MLECNNNYGNHSRNELHKVCEAALSASRNVTFAALVNTNGILIVGKYRYDYCSKISKSSSEGSNVDVSKGCMFYLERLLPYLVATKKLKNKGNNQCGNLMKKDGERIELDLLHMDGKIKTAITKIPELPNMFLCVEYISS
jgi:hypothetical protein